MNTVKDTLLALAAAAALFLPADAGAALKAKKPAASAQQPAAIPQPDKTFPTKIVWTLYSFNGKPITGDVNFLIDDNNRGSGSGGCNTWSATLVPVRGQRLAMGPIAITKKQCAKEVTQLEFAFLIALRSGPHWDIVGPDVVIKGEKGGEMKFRRSL
jgi:heat shock protein HslJ